MYHKLKQLYDSGRIDEAYLIQAVKLGWITEEEKNEIMGIKEEEVVVEDTPTILPELER